MELFSCCQMGKREEREEKKRESEKRRVGREERGGKQGNRKNMDVV